MRYLCLLVVLLVFCSCNKNTIDKRIAIKIGQLEITNYEFNRNLNRELLETTNDSNILNNSEVIGLWKESFIDRCYIVNDAYEKGYDTLSTILDQVEYMGNYMMCSRYGYLWKETIEPIVAKAMEMTPEKIEKRKKLYYFDCIVSHNLQSLLKITNGDTIIKSKEEFMRIKSNTISDENFSSFYFSQQWPFVNFWYDREYICTLNPGEISKPIVRNGYYYYLYVDHIEEVPISETEIQNAATEMQLNTEEVLISRTDSLRDAICKPELNYDNIAIIAQFLSEGNELFDFDQDVELIKYTIDGNERIISFKQFINNYSNQPLRQVLNSKEDIVIAINDYYMDDYLINEAKKLDLYNSDIYLLDQNTFKNNLIYATYVENEITDKIIIDTIDIEKYYKTNRKSFKQPKTIVAKIYSFKNRELALSNKGKLIELLNDKNTNKTIDSLEIDGLLNYSQEVIDMEMTKYPIDVKRMLLNTKTGNLSSMPINYNGNYIFCFKESEDGETYIEFEEVYDLIEQMIRKMKTVENETKLVAKLKEKYKLEIDKTRI